MLIFDKKEGFIELCDFMEGGGGIVRCYPDGKIELFEVPIYGGDEIAHGIFPTINAAFAEVEKWT